MNMKIDSNTKILITGCAGFIGYHLAKNLLQKNITIIGIDNLNPYYSISLKKDRLSELYNYSNFQFVNGDISDKECLESIFTNNTIDIVVNLAAQAGVRYSIENPDSYIASNIIGFYNILECCRHYSAKHLVYASSSSVYGANKKTPFSVEDKTDYPVSLYAATKKSNELLAYSYSNLYHFPATGLRFFTVYGPFGRPDMAYFNFTKKILANEPIQVFNQGDLYRDFTYIDDIIYSIDKILTAPPQKDVNNTPHKVYNIGNNQPEKLLDFIEILEDCLGKKAIKEFCPMQAGDVYQTYADVNDLIVDFNFKPNTTLKDGLEKFTRWYCSYYK